MPLRKEPKRTGQLRVIDVEDFDLSACGGTHVSRTGAIGIIAVASWERFKGGQRLEFLCGGRALARFRTQRDVTAAGIRLLSVLPSELPGAIERLQLEEKNQKRALTAVQTELARHQARALAENAEVLPFGRVVLQAVDADAYILKALASAITAQPGYFVVLISQSSPSLVVAARSADVSRSSQEIVVNLTKQFGGRGGGKPDLAQGGGLSGAPNEILAGVRAWLL